MTTSHPLDNVLWTSLSTSHAHLALGDALARRFRPEYAVFAGMPQRTPAAFDALAALMQPGEVVAMAEVDDVQPGPRLDVLDYKNLVQMIGPAGGTVSDESRYVVLGPDDVAQMNALVELTAPGPWAARTSELGRFVGFKSGGRLVAMAGERLRVPGHCEVSGVCCHPEFRGRGLPADLMRLVSQAIVARGELPFLHVLAENTSAIALYDKLGFQVRQRRRLAILRRNDSVA